LILDLGEKRLEIGVGELLGESAARAIGITGTGLSRLWIGQELHRRVQRELAEAEPGFRSEVHAEVTLEIDGWAAHITGRADGVLYEDDTAVRIDEIKTLHFAVDLYNLYLPERLERYKHQARLYAYMLSPAGTPAAARLILVDIVTAEERHETIPWSAGSVEAWIRQQVHRLVAGEQKRQAHLERMARAAELVPYPFPCWRPAQEPIAEMVRSTLDGSRHLLLEAPTGCGKTAAVLHPAMRSALSAGRRVFYVTAKTLQQSIAVDTARKMQGTLFSSLQLRSKAKMCANSETICHEECCPYARDYGLKLVRGRILEQLLDSASHHDPDTIFEVARHHEVCPFEVSLDLLPEVDLVICDYNYVFDPTIGLHALLHGNALENAVIIIDEAHNLVERSREYYSPTLGTEILDQALAFLATRDAQLFRRLSQLFRDLRGTVEEIVRQCLGDDTTCDEGITEIPEQELADHRIALDGAMLQYFVFKREQEQWLAVDPVLDAFLSLTRFHRVLALSGEEFVHLAGRREDGVEQLKIYCRDASRFLGALLDEANGSVAMSATLAPFEFFRNLLGFDPHRTDDLSVPSPFPPENRLVIAIDDVDTTFRHRAAHYDRIASWIARLAEPDHNVLALFPSYAFLAAVLDRLPAVSHTVYAQQPGSSDAGQRELLDALANGSSSLVLAVLGGVFAEGVDYPGEMLSQVIVVSPGLPQYNLERELLKAYYQERYHHGFAYAYLIPGMTRVVQAAGRLLRSDTDRGVIALVGRRFQDSRYARLLPEDWTGGDATSLLRPDPVAAVRAFFQRQRS
jgi:DNA excision repair protein ERCC-2